MIEFVNPLWLWGLVLVPIFILYQIFVQNKKRVRFIHSRFDIFQLITKRSSWLSYLPLILRSLVLISLLVALARPRIVHEEERIIGHGIDIMISLDVSGSMRAVDFQPVNRLEAAKKVARYFVEKRKNDRIGMVVFAGKAFTRCPLTLDYNILMNTIDNIDFPQHFDGTAIGMGLATAVARLKDSDAESKVIILVTDGMNNTGEIDPLTAAQLAATYGIKVYPIAIGTYGPVDFPVQTPVGIRYQKVEIGFDMDTLEETARITGTGRAWHAEDTQEFEQIIDEIDALEASEYEIEHYYHHEELFFLFLLIAFGLLLLELILRLIIMWELP
jgi:Ca-activated chloride channel family protein